MNKVYKNHPVPEGGVPPDRERSGTKDALRPPPRLVTPSTATRAADDEEEVLPLQLVGSVGPGCATDVVVVASSVAPSEGAAEMAPAVAGPSAALLATSGAATADGMCRGVRLRGVAGFRGTGGLRAVAGLRPTGTLRGAADLRATAGFRGVADLAVLGAPTLPPGATDSAPVEVDSMDAAPAATEAAEVSVCSKTGAPVVAVGLEAVVTAATALAAFAGTHELGVDAETGAPVVAVEVEAVVGAAAALVEFAGTDELGVGAMGDAPVVAVERPEVCGPPEGDQPPVGAVFRRFAAVFVGVDLEEPGGRRRVPTPAGLFPPEANSAARAAIFSL